MTNLMLLIACAVLQDGQERAKGAIEKVRGQKSYETRFRAEIRVPNSDPMVLSGESVWVGGGILFIHYEATGRDVKRIVRAGNKAWVYHEIEEAWFPADQLGMNGAGRGVQNPDEVLGVLAGHLGDVSLDGKERVGERECDAVRIRMGGTDIEKMMKEQAQQKSFDWKESVADTRLLVGADGLIYRLASKAELVSTDPNIKGQKVHYGADVEVTSYNSRFAMAFSSIDPKTKKRTDIPLDLEVLEAIEGQKGVAAELLRDVGNQKLQHVPRLIDDLGSDDDALRDMADAALRRIGRAAAPELRKVIDDKKRGERARKILAEIEK